MIDDYDFSGGKLNLNQLPGDIGTVKQPTIEFSKNMRERFNYKSGAVSASDRRFEHSPNKLESLSKHRNQPQVDFERYSHRNMNIFEENKFINPGTGRKQAKS